MKPASLKLMIPGPIQPADDVLEAMGGPVQVHYGIPWTAFYNETLELLRGVFNTQGHIFLINGSGTCGNDAAIGSALSTGESILVGINGFFGERLEAIARGYGLKVIPVYAEWGQPLDPREICRALEEHPEVRVLTTVHLETSTSVVNPVRDIGQISRELGRVYILDAVSSLGGLEVRMDDWGIDICASASQKCLGAPPGLSPVAVGPRGWEVIDRNPDKGHGFYSDLRILRHFATSPEWKDWHPYPVTMATSNIVALHTSLEALAKEGIPARLDRYRTLALRLRAGLRRLGMLPLTPDDRLAPVLTTAYGPAGVPTGRIVEYLAEEHGIKISGGLGILKDKVIRIGHMSPTISEADIDEVLGALEQFRA